MPYDAPSVDGTPTFKIVHLSYIDASGDVRTDSVQTPATMTDAQASAFAVASGDLANASLYRVAVEDVYNSIPDKSNATDEPKESVFDNFVILAKNDLNASARAFIPSPLGSLFVTGTDQVDPSSVPMGVYLTAYLAMVGAGWQVTQIRYTERREINEAVKI